MAIKITRRNGVKVLNVPGKINPIERDPVDNTADLEQATFAAQSRRKFNAPKNTAIPGTQVSAPPTTSSSMPG